MTRYTQI